MNFVLFAKFPAALPQGQTIPFITLGKAALGSEFPKYSFRLERENVCVCVCWGGGFNTRGQLIDHSMFSATLEQTKIAELLVWNKRFC